MENLEASSLVQGSKEWLDFRNKKIGASDAAIIIGWSPWKSSIQLWMEKTGKSNPPDLSDNFYVQRGVRLEPSVRGMLSLIHDKAYEPTVMVSPSKDFLLASLDCWNPEIMRMAEIKVGNKKDHLAGKVPKKYYPQIQQQIYVSGAKESYYVSYYVEKGTDELKGDLKIIQVERDDRFLDAYLPLAEEFYDCMIKDRPPSVARLTFDL